MKIKKLDYIIDQDGFYFETNKMYRHFKGNLYYVHSLARHTETDDLMVVYQALYDDGEMYVRPYSMFTSFVPEDKENPTKQKYRFEPIEING